jgi:hypothetical protein
VSTKWNEIVWHVVKAEAGDVNGGIRVVGRAFENAHVTWPLQISPLEVVDQIHGHRQIMEVDAYDPSTVYNVTGRDIDPFAYMKTGADAAVAI